MTSFKDLELNMSDVFRYHLVKLAVFGLNPDNEPSMFHTISHHIVATPVFGERHDIVAFCIATQSDAMREQYVVDDDNLNIEFPESNLYYSFWATEVEGIEAPHAKALASLLDIPISMTAVSTFNAPSLTDTYRVLLGAVSRKYMGV
jgi:hypothetical protein